MFNIGPLELMLILIVALLVVGPKRLPEVGRSIGRGLREFRKAQDEVKETLRFTLEDEPKPPTARATTPPTPPPPAAQATEPATEPAEPASEAATTNPATESPEGTEDGSGAAEGTTRCRCHSSST
ncbi:MAG: twin-arginine translocase TatA/TatE family subunit [Actinobacteria bacterium]|nr:twin-arginine translocase TatA/TatE family subunit [Actinomycetota bacterium]